MNVMDSHDDLNDALHRMCLVQSPSRLCHKEWLKLIFSHQEISVLQLAIKNNIRLDSIESKVNSQHSCIVPLSEILGPFGYIFDLSQAELHQLMCYFALYILHFEKKNKSIILLTDAQHQYNSLDEWFNSEGIMYRNIVKPYIESLQKMLMISFGAASEKINMTILSTMGFFCFRSLLQSQLSSSFMNIIKLQLDPSFMAYNPFQYEAAIVCRNSKISFLIKSLVKQGGWLNEG